jgi:YD repeat-containing protein
MRFVYDEVGRLLAVRDPASDTAVYRYDPVGNLLAIDRPPPAELSVISVSPDHPDPDDAGKNDCDVRTYRFVEVFAQVIQGSGPMDPALRARTHTCLDDAGVRTSPDDRTDKEIFITAGKQNVDDVVDCLQAAFRAEFPDREEIGLAVPPEVMDP